jgi:hypothetical protein
MDLIILYTKITAGIESLIAKHQIQNFQLKKGDKGQRTKDLIVLRNLKKRTLRDHDIQILRYFPGI